MSLKSFSTILWLLIALPYSIETINAQTGIRSQIQTQNSTDSNVASNPSNNTNSNSNVTSNPSNNRGTSVKSLLPVSEPIKPEPPVAPIKERESIPASSITKPVTTSLPTFNGLQNVSLGQKIEIQPTDPEIEQTYKDTLKDYYSAIQQKNQAASKTHEFNNWVLENRKATFDWQHFTGKIIFGMVIFLVLTGVTFSGIQFYIAMKQTSRRKKVSKSETQESEIQENGILPTTLKANLSGVEVSSSIFGVIILIVSFLFFYLYLVYVYPITVIAG